MTNTIGPNLTKVHKHGGQKVVLQWSASAMSTDLLPRYYSLNLGTSVITQTRAAILELAMRYPAGSCQPHRYQPHHERDLYQQPFRLLPGAQFTFWWAVCSKLQVETREKKSTVDINITCMHIFQGNNNIKRFARKVNVKAVLYAFWFASQERSRIFQEKIWELSTIVK